MFTGTVTFLNAYALITIEIFILLSPSTKIQVSCLNDVCGMFPFISLDVPDQFYRLFTSLCLHAGILHLAITIAFQHIYLADLERLIGPIRTAIVYIGSGVAGNLTSAIFVPYKPEVSFLLYIEVFLTKNNRDNYNFIKLYFVSFV